MGTLTRRSAILQCLTAAAALSQSEAPLSTLRSEHPRLLWLPADVQRTHRLLDESTVARKCLADLEREADRLQNAPLPEYRPGGARQLQISRRLLDRVYTLSLLYRLDGKRARLDRAVKELRAAAALKDWNPSHFIDLAEMTHAFAIGYDWLYADLSDEDRLLFRTAIVQKGLDPGLQAYASQTFWVTSRFNWNLVCNSGLTLGALAVADTDPEKAAAVLKAALEAAPRALASYAPDGGWAEGPAYWEYSTHYAVLLLAGLESALGKDFGLANQPGFGRAGRFRIYSTGPTTKVFNFGDSGEEPTEEPAMFWLSKRFAQPVYTWQQTRLAERAKVADALNLVWFQRDGRAPAVTTWPLDAIFGNVQCAFLRSSWEDPNALFVGVKGGDNKAPHNHLDLGSFVFDAGGVRWAVDIGPSKTKTESHNTLLIGSENQDAKAEARIVKHEFGTDASWVQLDLSHAYMGRVKNLQRRIGMLNRQAVLIEDTLQADQPLEVLWGMVTDADAVVDGATAVLSKNGWVLEAEIQKPRHAVFDIVPVIGNFKKLVVRVGERVTDLDMSVLLTPHKAGTPKPKTLARFAS